MRKSWLIIAPVLLWGLHAWLSEDEVADPGAGLAGKSQAQFGVQTPSSQGYPTSGNGFVQGRGVGPAQDWRTPPAHRESARIPGEGAYQTFPGEAFGASQVGGYRFRPLNESDKRRSEAAPPSHPGRQYESAPPSNYARQYDPATPSYSTRRYDPAPPSYSPPRYDAPQPAYSARDYAPAPPVYGNAPAQPRYGALDQMGGGYSPQLRFRPLEKSQGKPGRWTGNYQLPRQRYSPESYGQRTLPQGYGGSDHRPWTPPSGNPMLLYNPLGVPDVYSSR